MSFPNTAPAANFFSILGLVFLVEKLTAAANKPYFLCSQWHRTSLLELGGI